MLPSSVSAVEDEANSPPYVSNRRLDALSNLLRAGLIIWLVLLAACEGQPYGFFDESIPGELHNIVMDGRGGYKLYRNRRSSPNEPYESANTTLVETGTYQDGGRDEITLTTSDGHTYKIRVWKREDKDARYRVLG